ncbi:cirrhosis, autosomal recessive 1A (cirhin), partial [Perkinsus olseni]
TWAVRCVIPGCEGERSVRRLCFVEGRLFSTGVHGQITEWSTDTGKEMGSYPSNGGAIWDMAVDEERRLLAVSTESGAIPIYSLGPSGSTTLTRLGELKGEYQAAKKKKGGGSSSSATSRALSVCFGTVSTGRDDGNYRTIFSGNDRGVVSEWRVEVKEGDDGTLSLGNTTCVSDSMRILPHTNAGGGVLVWSLKALSKDRIVSGDSSGCLTLWDVDKHVQL